MHETEYGSRAIAIAIQLINSRNPKHIETLKKFLTFVPNPRCVRDILTSAVLHISQTSSETTCWLLQNPEPLQPEVEVIEVIVEHLSQKLATYGLIRDRDFQFDADKGCIIHLSDEDRFTAATPLPADEIVFAIVAALIDKS